ncbi:MAG: GNAT family N-acetyltransferase [Pseudopedobacter sp.]|nr:GNAT family N-acetyltransferase [Deinococcales bacterium]
MIRDLEHADYPQVAALQNAHYLHHFDHSPQQIENSDALAREKYGSRFGRIVLEQEGKVQAGLLFYPPLELSGVFRFQIFGNPAHYSALYLDFLTRVSPFSPRAVESVVREDMQDMDFLAHAGLVNRYQSWGAHLKLSSFEYSRFQLLEEKLFLDGYELNSLEHSGSEALWQELYVLFLETWKDAPYNPTTTPDFSSFEDFRDSVDTGRAFYAAARGKIVGYTLLSRPSSKGEVSSEHTAIHPQHRTKGLATTLKATALEWARREGVREASTGGTVMNLPMLRVNQKLGYAFEPMWCTWWLELNP